MRPYHVVLAPRQEVTWTVLAYSAMDAIVRADIPADWDIVRVEVVDPLDDTVSEVAV